MPTETPEVEAPALADPLQMTKAAILAELGEHLAEEGVKEVKGQKVDELRVLLVEQREKAAGAAEEPAEEVDGEVVDESEVPATEAEVEAEEASMMLARREPAPMPTALPSPQEWEASMALAETICKTEFVPSDYRGRPDAVLAAILVGRELNIGPMQALREIYMIDGRPALAAHLLLARLRQGGIIILESESTATRAMIHARRRDTGEEATVEWTIEEAQNSKDRKGKPLTDKDNWRNYPADMLWARCVGRLTRRLGSDLVAGLPYTSEEVADFDLGEDKQDYRRMGNNAPPNSRQNEAGRVETPRTWAEIFAWAEPYGPALGWAEWVRDASQAMYGFRERDKLKPAQLQTLGQKASGAIIALREAHDPAVVPPPNREVIATAWSTVMDGLMLPGPPWRLSPEEEDRPVYEPPPAEPKPAGEPAPSEPAAAEEVEQPGDDIEWPDGDPSLGYGN